MSDNHTQETNAGSRPSCGSGASKQAKPRPRGRESRIPNALATAEAPRPGILLPYQSAFGAGHNAPRKWRRNGLNGLELGELGRVKK
jgi:hypothetical protein